ncbi:MAG: DUF1116 domain-containing protein, partial [Candidatus Aminicenantes bacterium]|nr:DUF1116 domain-containing protein [Candidatus Aminicenantes bacterium]
MNFEPVSKLFLGNLSVVNLGLESFARNLSGAGLPVVQVDWKPPAGGDSKVLAALDAIALSSKVDIDKANDAAVSRVLAAKPTVVGIGLARDVVPGMRKNLILHAGPPVTWQMMCGPMRGAVMGGLLYEGLAKDAGEAARLAASGEIDFEPCHHHASVGPMAGVITSGMPVWILENKAFGNRAFCTLNEGLGKVLRYGAYSEEVLVRLRWMRDELAPVLAGALGLHGPMDMKTIIAQILQMGDDGHNRNRAGTSIIIRELAPYIVLLDEPRERLSKALAFMNANDHFFLNLSMPSAKCSLDPAMGIEGSSMIVTMARNGTEFGIRVSGLGERWFTGPAGMVEGLYLPGFSAADAARDIGDSVITETAGIGGFAMAAAPAIVKFVGGSPQDSLDITRRMYEICITEN